MELIISKPNIIEENGYSKLQSKILTENISYDFWFKVESKYTKYLCTENSDAFLIALLPYMVKHEMDLKIEGKISSKLYYQITTYLLPMLCNAFGKRKLEIKCELTDAVFDSKGVGASISGGVDSFYTILKHTKQKDKKYNITHLTFFNAGSNGGHGGEKARELYQKRLINTKKFCEENNYKLVTVDSNMNEFLLMNHEKTHTFRTLSCVLALQKLFHTYYFASGLEFDGSHIDEHDTANYDILNVHCLSNENVSFYCSGLECSRMNKLKYISDFEITYKWLNVCIADTGENCGKCEKCIRTMTALESINKLDRYKNVFNLQEYKNNKSKIYARVLKGTRNKNLKEMYRDIVKEYKNHKKRFTFRAYCISLIPTKREIKSLIKHKLPTKLVNHFQKDNIWNKNGWTN